METQLLIAELSHEINSPLAAIRNALYLVATRSNDDEVRRYLEIADGEVVRIAQILRASRTTLGAGFQGKRTRSNAA